MSGTDRALILGIETTCDETSAAVVTDGPELLSQVVLSQAKQHADFGGVVPELASRSHVKELTAVVEQTLQQAKVDPQELSAIAVASRPGLIGALIVGVTTAKALAWAWQKPLIAVHHLEAHLEAPAIADEDAEEVRRRLESPYLGVILSGGHTDLYHVDGAKRVCLGATRDDALGEAFDKVASILGLGYPGGPAVERCAKEGDPKAVPLPKTLLDADSLDFSFSGIKTAVLYMWRGQDAKGKGPIAGAPSAADICAGFQETVGAVLTEKLHRALDRTGLETIVFGGGVTANQTLRQVWTDALSDRARLIFPPPRFSTDNGAMIAASGLRLFRAGEFASLDLEPEATP